MWEDNEQTFRETDLGTTGKNVNIMLDTEENLSLVEVGKKPGKEAISCMCWPTSTGRDVPFRAFQATGLTGVKPRSRELMVDQRSQAQWGSVCVCVLHNDTGSRTD